MLVTTWNVLHHVHAVNWHELPAGSDERARLDAIAGRVEELLLFSFAVCLQEVSGDQLRTLRAPHVFSFELPRVPQARHGEATLSDPTEHLVVLASLASGRVLEQHAFASDPGKGFLAVELSNGLVVVSTHISSGERAGPQLETLATWARAQVGRGVVIGGDFNADRRTVMDALGRGFHFAPQPARSRPSRPRAATDPKSQHIDHVIGHNATASETGVEDGRGLSDHNPVWSKFI